MGLLDYDEDAEPMVNIATGLHRLAKAVYDLGHSTGPEPTTIEWLGMRVRDDLAPALESIARAIEEK